MGPITEGAGTMNLVFWTTALILLGLATFGVLFAFAAACDKV
jgi:hypothetical protein